jgi:hypothetical protein
VGWGTHEDIYPAGVDERKSPGPIPMKEKLRGGKAIGKGLTRTSLESKLITTLTNWFLKGLMKERGVSRSYYFRRHRWNPFYPRFS